METRQNHVLVGAVALALLAALFAFVLWLSRVTGEPKKEYDIFYKQSVTGLAVGSQVLFGGVPVGQVQRIALMTDSPEFVRVRISVDENVPILQGTTAAIEGVGFTGVSQIQLSGAVRGAAPIDAPGPFGVPVIPARSAGIGELIQSAPQVIERASILLSNLNSLLDEKNRGSIANILRNLDATTATIAGRREDIAASLDDLRATLRSTSAAADQVSQLTGTTNRLLNEEGRPLVSDLRATVARANETVNRIDALVARAEPGVSGLTEQTLPEVNRLVRDLRDVTGNLGAISAKLDEDPAGAVLGGRKLPDYVPPEQQTKEKY